MNILIKTSVLVCLISLSILHVNSQILNPALISAAGNIDKNHQLSLEWSVGEPFIETVDNNYFLLTQGFHQPYATLLLDEEEIINPSPLFEVLAFPNPAKNFLNLKLKNTYQNELEVRFYDLHSKMVHPISVLTYGVPLKIKVNHLRPGVYFLFISDIVTGKVETRKIIIHQ